MGSGISGGSCSLGQDAACGVMEEDESISLPLLALGSLCDFIWTQSRQISRVTTAKLQSQVLLSGVQCGQSDGKYTSPNVLAFSSTAALLGTAQIYCPCIITAPRRNNNYFLKSSEPLLGRLINPFPVLG